MYLLFFINLHSFKGLCHAVCDHLFPNLEKDPMYLYCSNII